MSSKYTLPLNDLTASLDLVGGKGVSLSRLANAGFPVPDGYHITTLAYRKFVHENSLQPRILEILERADLSNPESLTSTSQQITAMFNGSTIPSEIANAVIQAYSNLPGTSPPVAVRSSATAEDLPEASFAGQQETYLNISGADALLNAVRKCWASLWTARAIGYRARQNIAAEGVALAVVVQLLIPAEAAGIMFTANPITGERDQIVINASWGLGEAVVGGLVTPDTITLEKPSLTILNRDIAKKLVQTEIINGGTQERPVSGNLQMAPVLNDRQAVQLAGIGKDIENLNGTPMDIEWTLAEGKFSIVQARLITTLPGLIESVPNEWKLPEGAYVAMRNNIVELMADPLTPLFKTLGLSVVNRSMGNLLAGFFGNQDIMPGELIIAVNEYAYYNGSVRFGQIMKIILNTPGILRRMFTGAVERWTEEGRPRYIEIVSKWQAIEWKELPSTELLTAVEQLAGAAIDAYGSLVSGVIPAAWISEALFTYTYKLVKRRDDPPAPTFLMGFDSLPILAEKSLFDISKWVLERKELSVYLRDTSTTDLVSHLKSRNAPESINENVWKDWQQRLLAYLEEYGHMIYNLDFANPVPADDPAPVLETLKLFISGQGVNPHERQRASAELREQATKSMQLRLKGIRSNLFQKNLDRAQRYAPLREDGLADVGMSYPLMRQILLELGQRFVEAGLIDESDDIYWLEQDEVKNAVEQLDRGDSLSSLAEAIEPRKAIWHSANRLTPPMALPQIKIFGFDIMKLRAGRTKKNGGDTLKGVAASPGTVTAPASVLHSPEDFCKMRTGNVLVASITTPAWTPLFARAAAVVTDIGGPLSHGSIVAREYGIPAVLGTDSATKTIQDGQNITVDGNAGLVILK